MKVVIFAGGLGTRLMEETDSRPKPMVEIGGKPILWHIMKSYESSGFNEFIVCLGYKGEMIKQYFLNYYQHNSDLTVDVASNTVNVYYQPQEAFKVTLVDTGNTTKTAGRLKQIQKYLDGEDFMLTYGDGLTDMDLRSLLTFHNGHNKICTVTAIRAEARFGTMDIGENNTVVRFREKQATDTKWVNGGFFVLSNKVFDHLPSNADEVMWENQPLEDLSEKGELVAYKHSGFWKCMDALRDRLELEHMWRTGNAKWRTWD